MGCITLLSDFGLQDASVASAKGILMQQAPGLPIIDISHLVEPFHLQQAAYLLLSAYKNFAAGTCHIVLLDVLSMKKPRMILCEIDSQYFIAPDNGILSLAFPRQLQNVWHCYELPANGTLKDWLMETGRLVNQLQNQAAVKLSLPPCEVNNAPVQFQPRIDANAVECQIIHIDRYENVIINITKQQFEEIGNGRSFRIQFMRDEEINNISMYYNDVREGEKLCRFNSTGYMEIAINRGKAASLFGFQLPNEHHLIYNSIKIYFE